MKKHQVIVDTTKCIGCGLCEKTCVAHTIVVQDKKAKVLFEDCLQCGQCSAVCPKEAIHLNGYAKKPIEKIHEVRLHPEEVLDVIRHRRTIRQFKQDTIPKDVIEQILEAGRLTHTAKNEQDVSYIVLDRDKEKIEQMAVRLFKRVKPLANLCSSINRRNKITEHFFFFEAPAVIVVLAKDKTNGLLAAANMEFVAEANGLGVLFSGFFTMAANISPRIKQALQIPKGKKVAMTIVLGFPNVNFKRSTLREELDVTYR